jgi:hypothetical protein
MLRDAQLDYLIEDVCLQMRAEPFLARKFVVAVLAVAALVSVEVVPHPLLLERDSNQEGGFENVGVGYKSGSRSIRR